MTGLLSLGKIVGNRPFILYDSRCVPRPWKCSSGPSSFIVLPIGFGRTLKLPTWEHLQKKVAHLYLSTHPRITTSRRVGGRGYIPIHVVEMEPGRVLTPLIHSLVCHFCMVIYHPPWDAFLRVCQMGRGPTRSETREGDARYGRE